ncbi:hypothetical protein [Sporolactobacillus putidus]|uniref:Uncharacterized protein n=1 Tax=Sporolactobacillus putidus TaxID=492735 RepID=A0A917W2Z5_9BACL|nr:hypothetical protein [Sporolactobacillus putidus]GGL57197.1 hypothetical protein GCM10007968_21530 [Sporolactobacillus putidus]
MDVGTVVIECVKAIAPVIAGITSAYVTAKYTLKATMEKDAAQRKSDLQEQRYLRFIELLGVIKFPHDNSVNAAMSGLVGQIYLTADQDMVQKVFDLLEPITEHDKVNRSQQAQYKNIILSGRKSMGIPTDENTFPDVFLITFS